MLKPNYVINAVKMNSIWIYSLFSFLTELSYRKLVENATKNAIFIESGLMFEINNSATSK